MNRITQCLHGRGTVSSMMARREEEKGTGSAFLAYTDAIRPVIFWNLTGRCNLACEHCYNASGAERDTSDELSTTEAKTFIDDCGMLGVPVILLSGGEPLMRADIWELASHASSRGIRTALSTNGTLITPALADEIRRSGIGYVGISLDGATAATHDRFRNCPGAFERSLQAFRHCTDAGVRVASVSQTGEVYPCQFAQIPEFLAGSIRERPFSAIWNDPENPVLNRFRRKMSHLTGSCGRCEHREICGGGCRVRAYHHHGDLTGDDPFCFVG